MPELPDLQAYSRNLSKELTGRTVAKIHVVYSKKLKTPEKELEKAIKGATLASVYRDGKELHFAFDNGNVLAFHLMLKGRLQYFQRTNEHLYTIVEILFDNNTGVAITDFQKQATPTLNPEPKKAPDALSDQADYAFLKEMLSKSRKPVKKVLTDQNVIRGIGNAYADEILWHARISPLSVSNKIPDPEIRKLAKTIRKVFKEAEAHILKAEPGIIGGEIRDFLVIHNPDRTQSPTGAKILTTESNGRKTYYTEEQKLWS